MGCKTSAMVMIDMMLN